MPVRKFRTVEEMNAADSELWLPCEHPTLASRIRQHWATWSRLVPFGVPRGVHKYRSMQEAEADRETWEGARIQRIRDQRLKK
jgi:hypothetical protein